MDAARAPALGPRLDPGQQLGLPGELTRPFDVGIRLDLGKEFLHRLHGAWVVPPPTGLPPFKAAAVRAPFPPRVTTAMGKATLGHDTLTQVDREAVKSIDRSTVGFLPSSQALLSQPVESESLPASSRPAAAF